MSQKAADQKQKSKAETFKRAFASHKWLYLMLIPGVLYMLIFNYRPMGGLVIDVYKRQDTWRPGLPAGGCPGQWRSVPDR